jgi:hypothetical protein
LIGGGFLLGIVWPLPSADQVSAFGGLSGNLLFHESIAGLMPSGDFAKNDQPLEGWTANVRIQSPSNSKLLVFSAALRN